MSPSHTNKKGVRYRYYVSQALLQGRRDEAGSVVRVSAPDVEALIAGAVRSNFGADQKVSDRQLIQAHLCRAVVHPDRIAVAMRQDNAENATIEPDAEKELSDAPTISIPFKPTLPLRSGVTHAPSDNTIMNEATRSALLVAIARSRHWIAAITKDPTIDFEAIAKSEQRTERYARLLAPLAYLSPRIVEAIAEGRAPADLTVTRLIRNPPVVWADQEVRLGFS